MYKSELIEKLAKLNDLAYECRFGSELNQLIQIIDSPDLLAYLKKEHGLIEGYSDTSCIICGHLEADHFVDEIGDEHVGNIKMPQCGLCDVGKGTHFYSANKKFLEAHGLIEKKKVLEIIRKHLAIQEGEKSVPIEDIKKMYTAMGAI